METSTTAAGPVVGAAVAGVDVCDDSLGAVVATEVALLDAHPAARTIAATEITMLSSPRSMYRVGSPKWVNAALMSVVGTSGKRRTRLALESKVIGDRVHEESGASFTARMPDSASASQWP